MKRTVALILIISITLITTSIVFAVSMYATRSVRPKVEENIARLQETLDLRFFAFNTIIQAEQTQLVNMLQDLLPKLTEQLVQFNQPIEEIPAEVLQQWVKESPINEIYLISHTGEIVNTTFSQDLHFNLNSISSEMTTFLQSVYGIGKVFTDRITLSTNTGTLNTYAYYSPKGKNYIVEVSVDMRDYVRLNKGEDYLGFMFHDLFLDAIRNNDMIVDLDMFMYNDLAAWSMTREGQSMQVDVLHQLNKKSQIRQYEGDQLTVYNRFTPQVQMLTDYFHQELASKVTYNISAIRTTTLRTAILSTLAILTIVPFVYWLASRALQQRIIKPFVERAQKLENARKQAENLARTDSLTKLNNRRAFLELGEQVLNNAKRYDHQVSLLLLDIDFFKKVNDTFGHAIGDEALRKTSSVIQETLREADLPARFGGEEFAILLPETSVKNGLAVAERLREKISHIELIVPNGVHRFTVSIGVSKYSSTTSTINDFLVKADEALYKAKELGRNQIKLS